MSEQKKPVKKTKTKRKALGAGIDWSDKDLDILSEISATDLKAADALWQAEAPAKLKPLLKAQVDESDTQKNT